ncbi:hypothetical protein GRF56_11785 [Aeromonas veronii]|uniref:hypothetical protein n=1 Tax=Aeromonas veronii TaxID=654 RepID=UPI0013164B63|nr:hypothetical protein [Aeromonas veronii]MBL0492959.1 hypothetical protein [Aeromonas veronii]QHC08043.1 hypothetical protein GRF56_11785 [Aeromonas veronii]
MKDLIQPSSVRQVMPQLQFVNGYRLVVMGLSLPINAEQARMVFAQLQHMGGRHG